VIVPWLRYFPAPEASMRNSTTATRRTAVERDRGDVIPIIHSDWIDCERRCAQNKILRLGEGIDPSAGCYEPDLKFFESIVATSPTQGRKGTIAVAAAAYAAFPTADRCQARAGTGGVGRAVAHAGLRAARPTARLGGHRPVG
jgi:hypothetical protein